MHRLPPTVLATVLVAATAVTACGDDTSDEGTTDVSAPDGPTTDEGTEQRYPDVVGVAAEQGDDGAWTFRVTISSPYDTPERYADGWRVVGPNGTVFGVHDLAHDHAGEQPFTRTQRGVEIPDDVTEVTIEGRDQRYGFGGTSITVTLAPN